MTNFMTNFMAKLELWVAVCIPYLLAKLELWVAVCIPYLLAKLELIVRLSKKIFSALRAKEIFCLKNDLYSITGACQVMQNLKFAKVN